jgi:hypothetical protein
MGDWATEEHAEVNRENQDRISLFRSASEQESEVPNSHLLVLRAFTSIPLGPLVD